MNKTIIAIIVIAVVALGGYLLLRSPQSPAPSANLPATPSQETSQTPPAPTTQAPTTETPLPGSNNQVPTAPVAPTSANTVTYTDNSYSPSTLRVKTGATVTFKNQSSQAMWTASGVHPTHRLYPTTGGCIGSTFDACQGIQPGGSWSFKFDIAGTWKYHNHLSPGDTGTIVVK